MKTLRNTLLASGLSLAALAVQAQESPWASYLEIGTPQFGQKIPEKPKGQTEYKNNLSTYIVNTLGYNASESWALGAEMMHTIPHVSGGKASDFALTHNFLRFNATNKNVASFDGWTTNVLYRWIAPTTADLHLQGGLGFFVVRPAIDKDFGMVSLLVRYPVTLALTNSGQNKFRADKKARKGTTLAKGTLEIMPTFKVVPEVLNLSLYTAFSNKLTGAGEGKSEATWGHNFYYEVEAEYTLPVNPVFDAVGLTYVHSADVLQGKGFKLATRAGSSYLAKFKKTF